MCVCHLTKMDSKKMLFSFYKAEKTGAVEKPGQQVQFHHNRDLLFLLSFMFSFVVLVTDPGHLIFMFFPDFYCAEFWGVLCVYPVLHQL